MKHEESKIQIQCVKWFRIQFPVYVLMSIPNGGARRLIEAKIIKAEGQYNGVADLFLMYGNNIYNGLFIEMKTEKGRQSDSQKDFEKKCGMFGYKYIICRSFEEFRKEIINYINNKE